MRDLLVAVLGALWLVPSVNAASESYSPYPDLDFPRNVYWGDTHLHTALSPDAYLSGNRLTPDDAYEFAKGAILRGHNGMDIRLRRPLDFLVVSDHAAYLGVLPALAAEDPVLMASEEGARWAKGLAENPALIIAEFVRTLFANDDVLNNEAFERSIWQTVIENAERHNDPGKFTAFIGYEYTSMPNGSNLHRNVVFRDGAERTSQVVPFSAFDSDNPEDLWAYMAAYERVTDGSVLSIPHNSNLSGGLMFRVEDSAGNPLTREYAERRAYFEPIVEATQYKGDSETHPYLSPEDEFADYETWDQANIGSQVVHRNDWFRFEYVRSALKLGLDIEAETGANPYRFGMIGSTDSHTVFATADERDYWGKMSNREPSRQRWQIKLADQESPPPGINVVTTIYEWQMAASGYAAVWATENTRGALFDAMRRKETYATTGPRMTVRFFGGFEFNPSDAHTPDLAELGYTKGVPMGGDLGEAVEGRAPAFLVSALKDPDGANLDRVQIVKGWRTARGELEEKVYDVAWSDERKPDAAHGKVPPVGNTVDVDSATYANTIGDVSLNAFWSDPDFDPAENAFYYARVIEIPKPRWTAYDQVRLGARMPKEVPMTTQDRAYTSPIWYTPK